MSSTTTKSSARSVLAFVMALAAPCFAQQQIDPSYQIQGVTGAPSGTGALCLTVSCSMTTPNLGTPSSVVLTNGTGLPLSGIVLPAVGSPVDTNTGLDWWRHIWSTGMTEPDTLAITLNAGAGTVDVAANDFVTRQGTLEDSPIAVYRDAGISGLSLTANDVSYVFRNYNGGTPVWQSGNLVSDFNGVDKVIAYAVARNGARMNVLSAQGINVDSNRKSRRRNVEWSSYVYNGFYQSSLGPSTVTASGLNLLVSAGKYFWFDNPHMHNAFDTTIAGVADANNFIYFYNRAPPWTQVTGQKAINATQYDSAGALTTMTNNRWRTDWLFVALDDAGAPYLAVVLGNAQYLTQTAAFADPQPAVPHQLDGVAVLLGQITIQKSDPSFTFRQAGGVAFTETATSVATALADASGQVDIAAAAAPSANQLLVATDATHAAWRALVTADIPALGTLPSVTTSGVIQGPNLAITATRIEENATNGNSAVNINYDGYAGGTTQYRDLVVYDGKNNVVMNAIGSTKAVSMSGAVTMPGLSTSSAATTGTMCWTTGTGNVNVDTTTTCLLSSARYKERDHPLVAGLKSVLALRPVAYHLKDEYNPAKLGEQVGLLAEDVIKVDARLVSTERDGTPHAVRYQQLTAVLTKAIQEQQQQINELKRQVRRLLGVRK